MRLNLFSLAFLLTSTFSFSQDLMLLQQPNLWHNIELNPAAFPAGKKIAIGLPAFSYNIFHSGETGLSNILIDNNGTQTIDFGKWIETIADKNDFFFSQKISTLSFGMRLPKGFAFHVGHAMRLEVNGNYPKNLLELIWNGNGKYIGETLEIAPSANLSGWNEWSLGLSKKLGLVQVGARAKLLSGTFAFETDQNHKQMSVFTNSDFYQLEIKTDYAFRSASVISAFDTSGYGYNLDIEKIKNKFSLGKQSGLAIDLGIVAQLTDRVHLSLSASDLGGKLNWKENGRYYQSKAEFTYDGITLPGADIINGTDSLSFTGKLDSLNDIFHFQKTDAAFTTVIPSQYLAAANVKISKKLNGGVSILHRTGEVSGTTAFGISATYAARKWISLGTMYSFNSQKNTNIGFSLVLKPGPIQAYFVSDNILNVFSVKSAPAINFRAGASLVF